MLFDSHCHLNDEQFEADLATVLERARAAGVRRMVVPGVDVASSERAIALAEAHEEMYAAVGIHPEAAKDVPDADFERIAQLALHEKAAAIGEIGLDYYWDAAPRAEQQAVLRRQLEMATACGLPVVIHSRDAADDTVALLEAFAGRVSGVMHCFSADLDTAKRCLDIGYYISFGGPLTFKKADEVRAVAAEIPDDRLLVETDAPYLSPAPLRGKRNEPERVRYVVDKLAEVRGRLPAELADLTANNAFALFTKVKRL